MPDVRGGTWVRAPWLPAWVAAAALVPAGAGAAPPDREKKAYEVPEAPVVLPRRVPGFGPLDAEVDAFVRIASVRAEAGVSGRKLAVVVVDSGVNPQHIAFVDKLLPGRNFTGQGDACDTADDFGHGSHVAGIIAARRLRGAEQPAGGRIPPGIANDAKIIPLKVYQDDRTGPPPPERINAALQWVLDHREAYRRAHDVQIGVVNISLGFDNLKQPEEVDARPLDATFKALLRDQRDLIRRLRERHVAVVAGAGNSYGEWQPEEGMAYPAVCPETISVGAVYDKQYDFADGPLAYAGDAVVWQALPGRCTPFTQRLGEGLGRQSRTDIFAPGSEVTSVGPRVVGDDQQSRFGLTIQNGTSQAAPVTAGVVLLLQDYYIRLTGRLQPPNPLPPVELIEACLRQGGVRFVDEEESEETRLDNVTSTGHEFVRVDAYQAYRTLKAMHDADFARVQLAVAGGQPLAGLTILGLPIPDAQGPDHP